MASWQSDGEQTTQLSLTLNKESSESCTRLRMKLASELWRGFAV